MIRLPAAVIFDMDGLLVDTETCDYQAWRELHELHGLELRLEEYCYNAGMYGSWERMYSDLSKHCGVAAEELHARREPRFRELVNRCLEPAPAVVTLLAELQAWGVGRGIASSSDREWVDYLLAGLGLADRFQAVVTGDDVEQRKPAPDPYLLAARRLGVEPAQCVALEDSAHGIQAAQRAGIPVVVVPNPVSRHQDLSAADARVSHLGEVTLELIAGVASNRRVKL